MNDTINVGDVFVRNSPNASFDRIEILGAISGNRYRAISTKRDGSTVPTNPYRSTLLYNGRYRREDPPVRDFNANTTEYKRPLHPSGRPTIDLPLVPTAAIREAQSYSFLTTETATLIHVEPSGQPRQAKSQEAKRQLLLNAEGGTMLLAVPGVYSMDVFYIDDRAKALGVLGLIQHEPAPQPTVTTAVDGSQWVAA